MGLEQLGLNKYETSAYETLIRLGKASALEVSRDSKVPYGRIYDVLNSLIFRGLAVVVSEKSKKFAPGNPEVLKKILENRKKELEEINEEIHELEHIYARVEQESVEIVKGKRNFYSLAHKIGKAKKYRFDIVPSEKKIKHWIASSNKTKSKSFSIKKVAMSVIDDTEVLVSLYESNTAVLIRDKSFSKLMRTLIETAWKN